MNDRYTRSGSVATCVQLYLKAAKGVINMPICHSTAELPAVLKKRLKVESLNKTEGNYVEQRAFRNMQNGTDFDENFQFIFA